MTIQSVPYALQGASHGAALFRQATSAVFVQGGILASGEFTVTQAGTPAMSVVVGPGRAKITGTSATAPSGMTWTTQGMYDVLNDANVTLTINAADATNPRIDLVYVQVQDSFYTGSTNTSVLAVATGTPAVSPAAPSTPANAIVLAQVRVDAGVTTILNAKITNTSSIATIMGQVRVFATLAALTAVSGPKTNDLAAVTSDSTAANNAFYWYTGSAWSVLTATSFDASAITSGTIDGARLPAPIVVGNGGTGKISWNANEYVVTNGTGSALTSQSTIPATGINGQLTVAQGGTGLSSMTTGFIKYNGTAVVSGQPVVASDISAVEQAKIVAGGLYPAGVSTNAAVNVFIQSGTPAGASTGDLWFW